MSDPLFLLLQWSVVVVVVVVELLQSYGRWDLCGSHYSRRHCSELRDRAGAGRGRSSSPLSWYPPRSMGVEAPKLRLLDDDEGMTA